MEWVYETTWGSMGRTLGSGLLIYLVVVASARLNGLRTFAKMSGYDFAATVAIGSIIASVTLTQSVPVVEGVAAVAAVVGSQRILTELRIRTRFDQVVDNPPVLVIAHGNVLSDQLEETGMNLQDVWSTLRANGLSSPEQATAMIFEPTGERSVLTGPIAEFDPTMFAHVSGREHLRLPTG